MTYLIGLDILKLKTAKRIADKFPELTFQEKGPNGFPRIFGQLPNFDRVIELSREYGAARIEIEPSEDDSIEVYFL